MHTKHRLLTSLVALSLPLALVGCGDDDGGNGSNGSNGSPKADTGTQADTTPDVDPVPDQDGGTQTDGGETSDGGQVNAEGFNEVRSGQTRVKNPGVGSQQLKKLTRDNADFGLELYGKLTDSKPGQNLFYSPYSLSSALAMTYAGAEGDTEAEMQSTLHFDLPESKLHPSFNQLDLLLEKRAQQTGNNSNQSGSPFQLSIANSVWGQDDFDFEQPFLDTLARHYGAGLRTLDFQREPDASRKVINKWVERKTENTIEKLLAPGSITPGTRMVLTNAIYFNASWKHTFDKDKTKSGPFQTPSGQVSADMMQLKTKNGLSYAEGSNYRAVEMPYVGDKVSMVVLVPDSGQLQSVESKLSGQWIGDLFDQLSEQPVDLAMPKFTYETKFSAKKMLKQLGMPTAFEGAANFNGISAAANLFIQDVVHKAFVAVDETGTEASAATAVTVGETSVPEFKEVNVDRPFLFFIQDRETDAVIFTGRVLDPTR